MGQLDLAIFWRESWKIIVKNGCPASTSQGTGNHNLGMEFCQIWVEQQRLPCHSMSSHPMCYALPFQNLMKFGIHVGFGP